MTRRAVILGGTGQLGAATARALLDDGWGVAIAHRGERRLEHGALADAETAIVERSDLGAVVRLCRGADLVLDCLAFAPADAEAHRRLVGEVGSVVVISTASVYRGQNGTHLDVATGEDDFPVFPCPSPRSRPSWRPITTRGTRRRRRRSSARFSRSTAFR